jgi:hypothetical protein
MIVDRACRSIRSGSRVKSGSPLIDRLGVALARRDVLVDQLPGEVAELRRRLDQDSSNSSRPPSSGNPYGRPKLKASGMPAGSTSAARATSPPSSPCSFGDVIGGVDGDPEAEALSRGTVHAALEARVHFIGGEQVAAAGGVLHATKQMGRSSRPDRWVGCCTGERCRERQPS